MEILETLLEGVRSACAAFPDKRRSDVTYSMADIHAGTLKQINGGQIHRLTRNTVSTAIM